MSGSTQDPYEILGVSARATDAEVRAAYRRLVKLHHPDHNGGSAESERRFEAVQAAYAQIRANRTGAEPQRQRSTGSQSSRTSTRTAGGSVEDRIAAMERELHEEREARERELREARAARERAVQAAREAAAATGASDGDSFDARRRRATDEELGYYETDDSFGKILGDLRSELSDLFGRAATAAERTAHDAAKLAAEQAAKRRRDHHE